MERIMTTEQLEAEARQALFGALDHVQGGYDGRTEPVTGREFATFAGTAFKRVGDVPAEGGVQPTPEEAMRVHAEALGVWLAKALPAFQRPAVCVRQWPTLFDLDGGWIAVTRLLVTEGNRDVRANPKPSFALLKGEPNEPLAQVRATVVREGEPAVGWIGG